MWPTGRSSTPHAGQDRTRRCRSAVVVACGSPWHSDTVQWRHAIMQPLCWTRDCWYRLGGDASCLSVLPHLVPDQVYSVQCSAANTCVPLLRVVLFKQTWTPPSLGSCCHRLFCVPLCIPVGLALDTTGYTEIALVSFHVARPVCTNTCTL